jgi:undecaprenyl-diphosphatase
MKRGLAAAVLFVAFLGLGTFVSSHAPSTFDRAEFGVFGTDLPLATFCRAAGQFLPYAVLCGLALVCGLIWRAYLSAALTVIVSMLVIWKVSDAFKDVFHRSRPEHWLLAHETSAGYPSGHATLALAFYGFAACVAWRSSLPGAVRSVVAILCVLWVAVMGWSRLALGAHFPTDVLGGYLLGGAGLCVALLAYDRSRGRAIERVPPRTRSRYTR